MGARLERLRHSRILTVTDGAPADGSDARQHGFATLAEYREARRAELAAALALAGLPPETAASGPQLAPIPVPDQTAALHLAGLVRALTIDIIDMQPEAILTHPYEGGHPDHDACAFAVHTAVSRLRGLNHPAPVILETPSYHAAANGAMKTGHFLRETAGSLLCRLTPEEQTRKRARLACFASQADTLAQFSLDMEAFQTAPAYDFAQPPHEGELFYERFPWGMTGVRFRGLAAEALSLLDGDAPRSVSSPSRAAPPPSAE